MKINFTKKDYLTLLEILHIAAWVLHAHRTDEPDDRKKYREFEQWIFSLAKDYGCENLIDLDPKSGRYWPTREHDVTSPVMAFIEEYNDESFWDELKNRLVDRDLCRELGEQKFSSLPIEERFAKAYEAWRQPRKIDFAAIVGPEMWQRHRQNWRKVLDLLKESQELANEIREIVARAG
ncbi:MAG: hypothetical protein ABSD58_04430 [Verrucomicrobiia bacterium]|jgi:hypothetical protein